MSWIDENLRRQKEQELQRTDEAARCKTDAEIAHAKERREKELYRDRVLPHLGRLRELVAEANEDLRPLGHSIQLVDEGCLTVSSATPIHVDSLDRHFYVSIDEDEVALSYYESSKFHIEGGRLRGIALGRMTKDNFITMMGAVTQEAPLTRTIREFYWGKKITYHMALDFPNLVSWCAYARAWLFANKGGVIGWFTLAVIALLVAWAWWRG